MNFYELVDKVIAAGESRASLESILRPIFEDAKRLQHLDDVKNDILPFEDASAPYPMVNAEWLLRTPNGLKDVGLRVYIDDDMAYWGGLNPEGGK